MSSSVGLPEKVEELLQSIQADRHMGAVGLARLGAGALLALVDAQGQAASFSEVLSEACRRLAATQPTMAPLFHVANDALLAWEKSSTPEAVSSAARQFLTHIEDSVSRIAAQAVATLEEGEGVILTHSYSHTVIEALRLAGEQSGRLYVLCTESRPILEGREAAELIAAAGLPVTLLLDAAGPFAVADMATAVWLGADSIAREGLYNKVGTFGLALAAQECTVPCYVLADRTKFWPDALAKRPWIRDRDPLEVWEKPASGVALQNRYFDRTPLERLSGVICETGLLEPEQVLEMLQGMPVHPELV